MKPESKRQAKICIVSSIPSSLWCFYRGLPQRLKKENICLEICSSPERELDYFKNQYGVTVHPVDIHRRITIWQDIQAIIKLTLTFKQNGYNIVHAHTPKGGFVGMISATDFLVIADIYFRLFLNFLLALLYIHPISQ